MNEGKILLGVLAGAATGAVLGVLFAPDSGANTRKKIMRKGEDYAGDLKSQFNDLASSLNDGAAGFKEEISHLVSNTKSKIEEEKSRSNNYKNENTSAIS